MQSIEYSAMWCLPSNPENTVAGSISFTDDDGILLQLIGAFGDFSFFELSRSHPILLGLSTNGKRITLTNCVGAGVNMSSAGFVTEAYKADFCFIGGHFHEPGELRFGKITVKYSHLSDWVRITGLSVKRDVDDQK